jgi:hypothetical protein
MQFGQLKRRDFITLLGVVLMPSSASRAQDVGRVYRLGVLSSIARDTPQVSAAYDELQRAGFVEGRNLGIFMAPDDTIWLTDDGDHTVRQCTLEGKVLLTLGISGKPAPYMSGEPFHRCTHTAMSPQGDIYVSDGYGNSRVHKYAPNGKLLFSWGGPGTDPGEFNIAHNITCDADGWVYVADRENHRVQVFDGNGKYETQWNNLHRPCGLFMPPGKCPVCYIGELGAVQPVSRNVPNLGPRITIVDNTGKRISRFGGLGPGLGPTEFLAPHGLAVDSRGDLYVGEVSWTNWPQTFRDRPRPDNLRSLHKFRKVG